LGSGGELPDSSLRAAAAERSDGTRGDDGKVLDFDDFFKGDDDEVEEEAERSDELAEYDEAPAVADGGKGKKILRTSSADLSNLS
jgi:hypothetical protein